MRGRLCLTILLCLPVLPIPVGYENVCGVPEFPENVVGVKMSSRSVHGAVTYFCGVGFTYTGTNPRYCLENGEWSGSAGTCKVDQCEKLPNPKHGSIRYSGYGYVDELVVICDEGYIYNHPESIVRTCLQNNTWSGKNGECEAVQCPKLEHPVNAKIYYKPVQREYQSTATLVCNEGFKYSKPESVTRTCQGDNRWSLDFDGTCKRIYCLDSTRMPDSFPFIGNHEYGSNATIVCIPGYTYSGTNVIITCQADGKWSTPDGFCMKNTRPLVLLTIPASVATAGILFFLCKAFVIRKRVRDSAVPAEELTPLEEICVPEKIYHVSFIINSHGDIRVMEKLVKGFISKSVNETGIEAFITLISEYSESKQMVFCDVKCPTTITGEQVVKALSASKNNQIKSGSTTIRDEISSTMATAIIKQKHVTDSDLDRNINLNSQYVRLKIFPREETITSLEGHLSLPDKYQTQLEETGSFDMTDEDIITPGETQKYIVIRGRAGIGKTTLLQRLMWRWAHGEWATHLKVIFLLNLRMLLMIPSKADLVQVLCQCGVYFVGDVGMRLEAHWLKVNQQYVGIVFDGLDEIVDFKKWWNKSALEDIGQLAGPLHWGFSIMKRICLPRSTVIVTSRPFEALVSLKPTLTVEVMGLTPERVIEFIDRNVKRQRVKMVKQTIKEHPILMSVCSITFFCAALCQVLQNDLGVTETLTTYTQIAAFITERFMRRSSKMRKVSDALETVSSSLHCLCQLAYDGLVKRTEHGLAKLIFDGVDLASAGLKQEYVETAREAGLLLQDKVSEPQNPEKFHVVCEFVHTSIQELLAMAGLLMKSCEEIKQGVDVLFTSGQFNMATLFLSGLAFNTSNGAIAKLSIAIGGKMEIDGKVCQLLKESICGIKDKLQLLQTVHESQSPDVAKAVGQRRFRDGVSFKNTKLTVIDILAIAFLLKHHHGATSLSLTEVGLDEISLKEIAKIISSNNRIKNIQLIDDGMTDESIEFLAQAIQEKNCVTTLGITGNSITNRGVTSLANALEGNTCLTNLTLLSNSMSDQGLEAIAAYLEVGNALTHLQFLTNQVTEKGFGALCKALVTCKTLKDIGLERTILNDKSALILLQTLKINSTVKVRIAKPICSPEIRAELMSHTQITMTLI